MTPQKKTKRETRKPSKLLKVVICLMPFYCFWGPRTYCEHNGRGSFWYKCMLGKWPGIDFASIPPMFVGNLFCMIWGFLEKQLKHTLPSKWSLEAAAAPKLILGGPRCLQKQIKLNVSSEIRKDAHRKSSRLVWLKSSRTEWRAMWWRKGFPDIYPWIIHG